MLERLVAVLRQGARHGDLRGINGADLRFRQLSVTVSWSVIAAQRGRSVFPRIRAQSGHAAPRHRELRLIPAEHDQLLCRLRTRDGAQIVKTLEEHIVGSSRWLLLTPATSTHSRTPPLSRANPRRFRQRGRKEGGPAA